MKIMLGFLVALIGLPATTLAADANKDEIKAITTIEKLGGSVKIDNEAEGPARLKVMFDKLDDRILTSLKGMTQISVLITSNAAGVTDRGMALISNIPNLQELTLEKAGITATGITHLKNLQNLKSLSLHGSIRINDAAVGLIKELKGLEELDLSKTALTDASFNHFNAMNSLKKLYLLNTKITDKGIVNLKGHKSLKLVGVGMTSISAKVAQEVEMATEGLRIRR